MKLGDISIRPSLKRRSEVFDVTPRVWPVGLPRSYTLP
jgi:hypothetical protein